MEISFKDKVPLVTGAASGISLATAKAFAKSGAAVTLADINADAARIEAKYLTDAGYRAIGIGCNVANLDGVEAMVK